MLAFQIRVLKLEFIKLNDKIFNSALIFKFIKISSTVYFILFFKLKIFI